jgi:hypothetical protein
MNTDGMLARIIERQSADPAYIKQRHAAWLRCMALMSDQRLREFRQRERGERPESELLAEAYIERNRNRELLHAARRRGDMEVK